MSAFSAQSARIQMETVSYILRTLGMDICHSIQGQEFAWGASNAMQNSSTKHINSDGFMYRDDFVTVRIL